jgi:hypothetical protein
MNTQPQPGHSSCEWHRATNNSRTSGVYCFQPMHKDSHALALGYRSVHSHPLVASLQTHLSDNWKPRKSTAVGSTPKSMVNNCHLVIDP